MTMFCYTLKPKQDYLKLMSNLDMIAEAKNILNVLTDSDHLPEMLGALKEYNVNIHGKTLEFTLSQRLDPRVHDFLVTGGWRLEEVSVLE